jgi:hypothetical protein
MSIHHSCDKLKCTHYFSKEVYCSLSLVQIHFHVPHFIKNM